ncbi:hypothetical protein GXW83_16710 [Streptacidiphilus sp. PB12-B1b]|uniref:DUF6296 family protein n=1 Tax=Streptacidiphilus sp. PB12-B1b TaxID=2705012 RepID=UPI0015FD24ED|nr:DUF6296 family protein [Streptacidiphilus sp. PB12-B1b]QMU77106.1 hypothetical protein GXW83_16710 [Streptacidiphilus sp. PB12-B1b]
MTGDDCFELHFATALRPVTATESVVVRRTEATGPGGHPIYTDETGIVRAEISDRCEVRMMQTSARQELRRPVACRRPMVQIVRQRSSTAA